ncbi:MAG: hypothetical protein ACXWLB_15365 [Reyranella sp.]
MTRQAHLSATSPAFPPPHRFFPTRGRLLAGTAGVMLAAVLSGAALAADPTDPARPQAVMLLTPSPIGKMQSDGPVAVKGTVAEIFGNKFVLQDDSGRALVDLGPRGDDGNAVTKGEAVTVQGMFDGGFIKGQVLVHADGRAEAFGPPHPPRPERGPGRPPGPRAERGPDRGPPPPPPTPGTPPPPAPAPR